MPAGWKMIWKFALALALVSLPPQAAKAHTRLKASDGGMVPRSASAGLKTAPCGAVARTNTAATFQPNQTITVFWEETIDHPGYYEFYFSPANDDNWVLLKKVDDDKNTSAGMPHQYSTTVTLPNRTCDACTFRLVQQMTENPANPVPYFSCADIKIVSATTPTPTPTPTPGPTTPTPTAMPVATPTPRPPTSATPAETPDSCNEHAGH